MAEIIQDSESILNHSTFPVPPPPRGAKIVTMEVCNLLALRADSPRRGEFELKHMD